VEERTEGPCQMKTATRMRNHRVGRGSRRQGSAVAVEVLSRSRDGDGSVDLLDGVLCRRKRTRR